MDDGEKPSQNTSSEKRYLKEASTDRFIKMKININGFPLSFKKSYGIIHMLSVKPVTHVHRKGYNRQKEITTIR